MIRSDIAALKEEEKKIAEKLSGLKTEWDEFFFFVPAMCSLCIGLGGAGFAIAPDLFIKILSAPVLAVGVFGITYMPINLKKREKEALNDKETYELALKEKEEELKMVLANIQEREEEYIESERRKAIYHEMVNYYSELNRNNAKRLVLKK